MSNPIDLKFIKDFTKPKYADELMGTEAGEQWVRETVAILTQQPMRLIALLEYAHLNGVNQVGDSINALTKNIMATAEMGRAFYEWKE